MSDTKLFIYFTDETNGYVYLAEHLADPDLRGGADLFEDEYLGIAVHGPGGSIMVADDPEIFAPAILGTAPDRLEKGGSFDYRCATEMDGISMTQAEGVVTFRGSGSTELSIPVDEAVASLRAAGEELDKLRAEIGG